jgi:hypothetical protein
MHRRYFENNRDVFIITAPAAVMAARRIFLPARVGGAVSGR